MYLLDIELFPQTWNQIGNSQPYSWCTSIFMKPVVFIIENAENLPSWMRCHQKKGSRIEYWHQEPPQQASSLHCLHGGLPFFPREFKITQIIPMGSFGAPRVPWLTFWESKFWEMHFHRTSFMSKALKIKAFSKIIFLTAVSVKLILFPPLLSSHT